MLLGAHLYAELPHLELVWAHAGYRGSLPEWITKKRGWRFEIVRHPDRQLRRYGLVEKPEGFQVMSRRWVVERTFAWLSRYHRLSKDNELLPATSETMIYGAMTRLMLRRLTQPKPAVAQAA